MAKKKADCKNFYVNWSSGTCAITIYADWSKKFQVTKKGLGFETVKNWEGVQIIKTTFYEVKQMLYFLTY